MEKKLETALTKCFYCGKDDRIVMNSTLTPYHANKVKDMHGKVIDKAPCNDCEGYMKDGIIMIGVRDGESGDNPYRTGVFCVLSESYVKRITEQHLELQEQVLKSRMFYMEEKVYTELGILKQIKKGKNDE